MSISRYFHCSWLISSPKEKCTGTPLPKWFTVSPIYNIHFPLLVRLVLVTYFGQWMYEDFTIQTKTSNIIAWISWISCVSIFYNEISMSYIGVTHLSLAWSMKTCEAESSKVRPGWTELDRFLHNKSISTQPDRSTTNLGVWPTHEGLAWSSL